MFKNTVFALLLCSGQLFSQPNTVDSLVHALSHTTDSSVCLHLLNSIAFRMHRLNPDSSIWYSTKAMKLAQRQSNDTARATAQYYIGIAHTVKGNYKEALSYTLNGLKTAEKIGASNIQSKITISLAILYEYLGEIDNALECNRDAIELARKTNDQRSEATALNNYAILLMTHKDDKAGAMENFKQSLGIRRKLNAKHQIASSLNNIGEVYMAMKKYDLAVRHYQEALAIYKEMNDRYGLAVNHKNIGMLMFLQQNYTSAINFVEKSIEYAQKLGLKQVLADDFKLLADIHAASGNYKNAYTKHIQYCAFKDSIYNENSARQIAEMKTRYETEKAQQEKALGELIISKQKSELKQQKTLRNSLVIGIILILVILLLIFNQAIHRISQKNPDHTT